MEELIGEILTSSEVVFEIAFQEELMEIVILNRLRSKYE